MNTGRTEARRLLALLAALCLGLGAAAAQRPPRRPGPRPAPPAEPSRPAEPPPAAPAGPETRPTAVINAVIHTGAGAVLREATLLVKNGKVAALGPGVETPEGAEIVDAAGRHLCPGVVATTLSGLGVQAAREGYRNFLNPFDPRIKAALAAGITASYSGGRGGLDGKNCVVKLAWGDLDRMLTAENTVIGVATGELRGEGRKGIDKKLEAFRRWRAEWQAFLEKAKQGDKEAKPPAVPPDAAGLARAYRSEAVLWVDGVQTLPQVRAALEFLRQVDIPAVLYGTVEGWIAAPEIGRARCLAMVWPRQPMEPDDEIMRPSGSKIEIAAILSRAGVAVGCIPATHTYGSGGLGQGGLLGWDMNTPFVPAAYAVRGGLDEEEALASVTLTPARMLGVAHRLGSLEEGKDADFLVMTGDPLHYQSLVDLAFIDGRCFYDRSKEPILKDVPRRQAGPK